MWCAALPVVPRVLCARAGTIDCCVAGSVLRADCRLLQSSDYQAPVIDTRIRDFLATFPAIIRDPSASAFENFRSGAANDVAETDKVNQAAQTLVNPTATKLRLTVSCAAECSRALESVVARAVHAPPRVEPAQ